MAISSRGTARTSSWPPSTADPESMAQKIRRIILEQSKRANVGHVGSCLSVVDIIAALYGGVLSIEQPDDPDRDRFVLSKGHNALTLFGALHLRGWLSNADMDTFCENGGRLGVHPDHCVPGVDFSTGSLGQGLSWAAGAALAARLQGSDRRVFALISDAECNEGSTWEAVMFAAHHRLSNLVAIIDLNGQQALGYTRDILDLSPIAERWRVFGWNARDVDGHDLQALSQAMAGVEREGCPLVIVAHTIFGRGVSFMERQIPWHYLPMSDEQYRMAVDDIDALARRPGNQKAASRSTASS